MKAGDLLTRVKETSGYAERKYDYAVIMGLIQSGREELDRSISTIPGLRNPFASIDQAFDVAGELTPKMRDRHLRFVYGRVVSDLDDYAGKLRDGRPSGTGFVAQPYSLTAQVELDAIQQKRRDRYKRSESLLEEVADLRLLAVLYFNALLSSNGIKLEQ